MYCECSACRTGTDLAEVTPVFMAHEGHVIFSVCDGLAFLPEHATHPDTRADSFPYNHISPYVSFVLIFPMQVLCMLES